MMLTQHIIRCVCWLGMDFWARQEVLWAWPENYRLLQHYEDTFKNNVIPECCQPEHLLRYLVYQWKLDLFWCLYRLHRGNTEIQNQAQGWKWHELEKVLAPEQNLLKYISVTKAWSITTHLGEHCGACQPHPTQTPARHIHHHYYLCLCHFHHPHQNLRCLNLQVPFIVIQSYPVVDNWLNAGMGPRVPPKKWKWY